MKQKILIVVGVVIAAVAVWFFYQQFSSYQDDQMEVAIAMETVSRPELDFTFTFPSGEAGFTLIEPPAAPTGLLQGFIMMPTTEYIALQNDADSESPSAMTVFVFSLEDEETASTSPRVERITRLQNWAVSNDALTSFSKAQNTPDIIELDGVKALHYRTTGETMQDIYLASYGGRVYMFASQFSEETDVTFVEFQKLIASVTFL